MRKIEIRLATSDCIDENVVSSSQYHLHFNKSKHLIRLAQDWIKTTIHAMCIQTAKYHEANDIFGNVWPCALQAKQLQSILTR